MLKEIARTAGTLKLYESSKDMKASSTPLRERASADAPLAPSSPESAWLELVAEKVRSIKFGVVQIVVHDAKVVQIERTERTRLEVSR